MPKKRKNRKNNVKVLKNEIIENDKLYQIINYVQTEKKELSFYINEHDELTFKNILKDLDLNFSCEKQKDMMSMTIFPPPEKTYEDDFSIVTEHFFDEIIEKGHCF